MHVSAVENENSKHPKFSRTRTTEEIMHDKKELIRLH